MSAIKQSKGDRVFNAVNIILMIFIMLIMLYPLYFTVIASVSDPYAVANGQVSLLPIRFTLDVTDVNLHPLQIVPRGILLLNQTALETLDTNSLNPNDTEYMLEPACKTYMAEGMKYSLIFIASAPLFIAYPFVQKYFVKGMMIGSLKG